MHIFHTLINRWNLDPVENVLGVVETNEGMHIINMEDVDQQVDVRWYEDEAQVVFDEFQELNGLLFQDAGED